MRKDSIQVVKMNNYVKPITSALLSQTSKYITNGQDNSYFYYVNDRYLGSPTNASIIDGYSNYILGNGLTDEALYSVISEADLRAIILDFKKHGSYAVQVVYSKGKEQKVVKLYHLSREKVAIGKQLDLSDDIESYWFCFDWRMKTKFKPYPVPAFGYGQMVDGAWESEILVVNRPSPQPLFPLPDYQSGLQWAETEEEMSNFCINHIKNNFSAGKIINVYQATEPSEQEQEEAEKSIIGKVGGSSNAGGIIIAFNRTTEEKTTVENIEITDAYQQFEGLSKESEKKIMLAHKVNDPALFGLPIPSGFNSSADQLVTSLKILYRSQIYPTRKIILAGLQLALKSNKAVNKIEFQDFEDLQINKTE